MEDAAKVIAAAGKASPGQATRNLERVAGWALGALARYSPLLGCYGARSAASARTGRVRLHSLGDVQHTGAMAGSL